MCFTTDKIEQACGFLLLNEFNVFVYCCRSCHYEYESGADLESHILSEHQEHDSAYILVRKDEFNVEHESGNGDPSFEIDTTNVKIEVDETRISEEIWKEAEAYSEEDEDELDHEPQSNGTDKTKPSTFNKWMNEENSFGIEVENVKIEVEDEYNNYEQFEENFEDKSSDSDDEPLANLSRRKYFGDEFQELDEDNGSISNTGMTSTGKGDRLNAAKNKKIASSKAKAKQSIGKKSRGRPIGSKRRTYTEEDLKEGKKSSYHGIFHCEMCPDKVFNWKTSIILHMQRHVNNELREKCTMCNKRPFDLEDHMTKQHPNEPFKCDICGKQFNTYGSIVLHIKFHAGIAYPCGICDKSFKSPYRLRDHEKRIHKRDIQCSQCEQQFNIQESLTEHILRMHSNKWRFNCEQCGKHFKTKRYLRIHQMRHEGISFPCRYCEKIFSTLANRCKHEKAFHKIS